jgi:hypothetical protein
MMMKPATDRIEHRGTPARVPRRLRHCPRTLSDSARERSNLHDRHREQSLRRRNHDQSKRHCGPPDVFEVFSENPDDADASGEKNLLASLRQVLESKSRHTIPARKHPMRRPDHRVEDVTELVRLPPAACFLPPASPPNNLLLPPSHGTIEV